MANVTVTFVPNGGTVTPETKTVTVGGRYGTLPTPTKDFNVFKGWYDSSIRGERVTETTVVSRDKDHSLYAQWQPERFTMNFNANGGTVSPTSKVVEKTCPIGFMPTPVRTGYVFKGWNTQQGGGGTTYKSDTKIPGTGYPTTLYAQWQGEVHKVTFDINGGLFTPPQSSLTRNYTYGQQYGFFIGTYDWGNRKG